MWGPHRGVQLTSGLARCGSSAKLVHCVRTASTLREHCVCTACSADTTSQGGREETPLHLCRCHMSLHVLGAWRPWPSAICCCVSVLEEGGSLLGS